MRFSLVFILFRCLANRVKNQLFGKYCQPWQVESDTEPGETEKTCKQRQVVNGASCG